MNNIKIFFAFSTMIFSAQAMDKSHYDNTLATAHLFKCIDQNKVSEVDRCIDLGVDVNVPYGQSSTTPLYHTMHKIKNLTLEYDQIPSIKSAATTLTAAAVVALSPIDTSCVCRRTELGVDLFNLTDAVRTVVGCALAVKPVVEILTTATTSVSILSKIRSQAAICKILLESKKINFQLYDQGEFGNKLFDLNQVLKTNRSKDVINDLIITFEHAKTSTPLYPIFDLNSSSQCPTPTAPQIPGDGSNQ